MNRIDPGLFRDCFVAWVAECRPDKLDLVAIDGKTSRRTHNRRTADKVLHLVSAFATNSQLVLGQVVFEKFNEITAPDERLELVGALVSIDAMGCQVAIAQSTLDAGADYLLAVKDNQPTLRAEIESYFATALAAEVEKAETIGKDHGRFEFRIYSISHQVDWHAAERSYPGAFRNSSLSPWSRAASNAAAPFKSNGDRISPRFSSGLCRSGARPLRNRKHAAHWVLDVTFRAYLSRLRIGHSANNMAAVRHFALNLLRQVADKRSIKRRKRAAWNHNTCWRFSGRRRLPWGLADLG
jgi:predicted transposase YbfD/YdcC